MAQAAAALGLDMLAGVGAHQSALAKLEALEEELDGALSRRKSNGLVRRATKVWRRGEIVPAPMAVAITGFRPIERAREPAVISENFRAKPSSPIESAPLPIPAAAER